MDDFQTSSGATATLQCAVAEFNQKLAERLKNSAALGPTDIARCETSNADTRLDRRILALGLLDEEVLLPIVCDILGIAFLQNATAAQADLTRLDRLTPDYLRAQSAFPLAADRGGFVFVVSDPGNAALRSELSFLAEEPSTFVGATAATIRELFSSLDEGPRATSPAPSADIPVPDANSFDGPVVKYVQEMLADAVLAGASDVHYEATEVGYRIRFRVHGILRPYQSSNQASALTVAARLKVLADLNVAERRMPQDGRFEANLAGRRVDFRVSTLPTQWGESIVCRLLDPKALRLGWQALGFAQDLSERVKAVLGQPHGLFLVTGPTGSGKTTTLYTALHELNTAGRKIITVEDPVEYSIPGIQQVQVQADIGLDFGRVLRSILRHDPNVILIGEIRDQDTAEIAVRAAQVGRLVLSTLHTSTPAGARSRLVDLGVPGFLVDDVLVAVLGQELVPAECTECGGTGCTICAGSGVSGRKIRAELVDLKKPMQRPG
jgi:general secretion pathway protein E